MMLRASLSCAAALLAAQVAFAADTAAVPRTAEGTLGFVVTDPMPGSLAKPVRTFLLHDDAGVDRRLEVDSRDAAVLEGAIGQRIRVEGSILPAAKARAPSTLIVRSLTSVPAAKMARPKSAVTTTSRPYISLLCSYTDVLPAEPQPPSYLEGLMGAVRPGMSDYFREASYGAVDFMGSRATGWRSIGHPTTYYTDPATPGAPNIQALFDDCTAAHADEVDFTQYAGINIVMNGPIGNVAVGGQPVETLQGVTRMWGVTWLPNLADVQGNGWNKQDAVAHELSHSLGGMHSESADGLQYANAWDVLSAPGFYCTQTDPTYGCLAQHMIANAKVEMGFIPAERIADYTGGDATYRIERIAQPPMAAGTHQMARIAIAGTTTRWYTVESRWRIGYDLQLDGDGVLIHEVDSTRSDGAPARLVVPGVSSAAANGGMGALWQAGMKFVSDADGIEISIDAISQDGTATISVAPHAAPLVDSFPAGCAGLPPGFSVPPGALGWHAANDSAVDGDCSLRTDPLPNPVTGPVQWELDYTGAMGTGNIVFWARAASTAMATCLRFELDGAERDLGACGTVGGFGLTSTIYQDPDTGWRFISIPVAAGVHTLRWILERPDANGNPFDAAWLDSPSFPAPGASGAVADVALDFTVDTPQPEAGKDVVFTAIARNTGPDAAAGVSLVLEPFPFTTVLWVTPGCVAQRMTKAYVCDAGTLPSGASARFQMALRWLSPTDGVFTNAAVHASTADPVPGNDAASMVQDVTLGSAAVLARYRLYNDVTHEHLYTTDANEYATLGRYPGWVQEGTAGSLYSGPASYGYAGEFRRAVPYYRLYDTVTHWHHWTSDANEYYTLIQFPNWIGEGASGYIIPDPVPGYIPLYRLLYPFVPGLHHWTVDSNEYQTLVSSYGWISEGISGYLLP